MTESFKLAVLGCGEQGWESRIPAALALADEGVEVVAVADTDLERANWVAADLGVPLSFGSLEEMIEATKLDGLIVALPPALHAWASTYALKRGLHVLCEKPLGRSALEARQMIEAASRANRVLAAGYQYPLQAQWSLRFADSGGIGEPYLLEASWLRSASASDRGIPSRPGFWNVPNGRGVGADLASHLLSVGLPLLGAPVMAVTAVGWRYHGQAAHGDEFRVEDTLNLVLDCVNGARGLFTAAWGAHLTKDEFSVRCQGTDGSLLVPLMAAELEAEEFRPTVIGTDGKSRRGEPPVPTEAAFVVQQRNWVRACGGEEPLLSRPEDALAVHEVLDAAYQSFEQLGELIVI